MHWRYDDDVTDEKLIFQLLALSLVAATLSNVSQNCGQETYVYNVVPNNIIIQRKNINADDAMFNLKTLKTIWIGLSPDIL